MRVEHIGNAILHLGENLEVLPTLEMVDAVVTDPPYGLEFMGKEWDHGVPGVEYWEAIMAIMKPGAHLLAFGGTRTFHRLTCAIEDAGLEIRDCIMWVYGSGFPKSLDVSKAIDKAAGAEREVVGIDKSRLRPNRKYDSGAIGNVGGSGKSSDRSDNGATKTAPATPEAERWEGWGTALKPAWEPIIVARKPLIGTVAANVLEHGTGGLNIDGGRVGFGAKDDIHNKNPHTDGGVVDGNVYGKGNATRYQVPPGRWPANLIHDGSEEATAGFPKSSVTGKRSERSKAANVEETKFLSTDHQSTEYVDSGSAARFFYCAKASKADRGKENNCPTVKPTDLMRYLCRLVTPPGGVIADPFMGSGSTGRGALLGGFRFIGIEKGLEEFDTACRRISQVQNQGDLFNTIEK